MLISREYRRELDLLEYIDELEEKVEELEIKIMDLEDYKEMYLEITGGIK